MKTTGIFKLHKFTINAKRWGKPFFIRPFGDIHFGAPHCAESLFREEITEAVNDPDSYLLMMGDYFDQYSSSERAHIHGKLHESTYGTWESDILERCEEMVKLLRPAQGRIIGMIEGNHFAELRSGATTTQWMCHELKCQYLGVMALIHLNIKVGKRTSHLPLRICAHHGLGAAAQMGGSLNRVSRLAASCEADIYLMGHDHKLLAGRDARLYGANNTHTGELMLKQREMISCRTGSYLRGYVDGESSYVADNAWSPSTLGCVKFDVTPICTKVGKSEFTDLKYGVRI